MLRLKVKTFFVVSTLLVAAVCTTVGCSEDNKNPAASGPTGVAVNAVIYQTTTGANAPDNVVQTYGGKTSTIKRDAVIVSNTSKYLVVECKDSCEKNQRYLLYTKGSSSAPEALTYARYYSQDSASYYEYANTSYTADNENICPESMMFSNKGARTSVSTSLGCEGERGYFTKSVFFHWVGNEMVVESRSNDGTSYFGKIDLGVDSIQRQLLEFFYGDNASTFYSSPYAAAGIDTSSLPDGDIHGVQDENSKRHILLSMYDNTEKKCTISVYTYGISDDVSSGENKDVTIIESDKFGYSCDSAMFSYDADHITVGIPVKSQMPPYTLMVYDTKTFDGHIVSKSYNPY